MEEPTIIKWTEDKFTSLDKINWGIMTPLLDNANRFQSRSAIETVLDPLCMRDAPVSYAS